MLHEWYGPFLFCFQYPSLPFRVVETNLEGLGEDGVVSEEECVSNDVPSGVPWEVLLVKKDAHELRDSEGWVGLRDS